MHFPDLTNQNRPEWPSAIYVPGGLLVAWLTGGAPWAMPTARGPSAVLRHCELECGLAVQMDFIVCTSVLDEATRLSCCTRAALGSTIASLHSVICVMFSWCLLQRGYIAYGIVGLLVKLWPDV